MVKLSAVLAMSLCVCLSAQTNRVHKSVSRSSTNKSSAEAELAKTNHYSNQAILSGLPSLPPNYLGADIKGLLSSISDSKVLAPKSEFETSAQYDARIASFANVRLLGDISPNEQIAFVIAADSNNLIISYDADTQDFTIGLKGSSRNFLIEPGRPAYVTLDLVSDLQTPKKYMGSNAMGASVVIEELDGQDYGLAIPPENWLFSQEGIIASGASKENILLALHASSDRAPSIKPQLRIAIVGKSNEPYILHDVFGKDATFTEPTKYLIGKRYLPFIPSELLLFRNDTGEILERQTLQSREAKYEKALNLKIACKSSYQSFDIRLDDRNYRAVTCEKIGTLHAEHAISVTARAGYSVNDDSFFLNGSRFEPAWTQAEAYSPAKQFVIKR